MPKKEIKGQVLAYFLASHPVINVSPLATDLPDEEVMTIAP